jgi:hypothetical protein
MDEKDDKWQRQTKERSQDLFYAALGGENEEHAIWGSPKGKYDLKELSSGPWESKLQTPNSSWLISDEWYELWSGSWQSRNYLT